MHKHQKNTISNKSKKMNPFSHIREIEELLNIDSTKQGNDIKFWSQLFPGFFGAATINILKYGALATSFTLIGQMAADVNTRNQNELKKTASKFALTSVAVVVLNSASVLSAKWLASVLEIPLSLKAIKWFSYTHPILNGTNIQQSLLNNENSLSNDSDKVSITIQLYDNNDQLIKVVENNSNDLNSLSIESMLESSSANTKNNSNDSVETLDNPLEQIDMEYKTINEENKILPTNKKSNSIGLQQIEVDESATLLTVLTTIKEICNTTASSILTFLDSTAIILGNLSYLHYYLGPQVVLSVSLISGITVYVGKTISKYFRRNKDERMTKKASAESSIVYLESSQYALAQLGAFQECGEIFQNKWKDAILEQRKVWRSDAVATMVEEYSTTKAGTVIAISLLGPTLMGLVGNPIYNLTRLIHLLMQSLKGVSALAQAKRSQNTSIQLIAQLKYLVEMREPILHSTQNSSHIKNSNSIVKENSDTPTSSYTEVGKKQTQANDWIVVYSLPPSRDQKCIITVKMQSLSKGKFVVLTGPNGCGKSTLLKAISGMHNCQRSNEDLSYIILPQIPILVNSLSILQNLTLGIEENFDRNIIKSLLEYVEISHNMDSIGIDLSGGERQRLAWARLLLQLYISYINKNSPEFIFLDEPFSACSMDFEERILLDLNNSDSECPLPIKDIFNSSSWIIIAHKMSKLPISITSISFPDI